MSHVLLYRHAGWRIRGSSILLLRSSSLPNHSPLVLPVLPKLSVPGGFKPLFLH